MVWQVWSALVHSNQWGSSVWPRHSCSCHCLVQGEQSTNKSSVAEVVMLRLLKIRTHPSTSPPGVECWELSREEAEWCWIFLSTILNQWLMAGSAACLGSRHVGYQSRVCHCAPQPGSCWSDWRMTWVRLIWRRYHLTLSPCRGQRQVERWRGSSSPPQLVDSMTLSPDTLLRGMEFQKILSQVMFM